MTGSTIEVLESRTLLSATAFVSGSTLHVNGNLLRPNTITVDDTGTAISVSVQWNSPKGVPKTFNSSFDKSLGFTKIDVRGGIFADNIQVGQHSAVIFSLPTMVRGLAGKDTITTSAESDTIFGGLGSDTINSGDGNDIVHGGIGADMITVGNGNDKVRGGVGADTIVAGDGTDTVRGGPGPDLITVGNGNDLVFGGPGNDTITAGNGNDTLWGGLGADSIQAGNGTDTFGGVLGDNTLLGGTGHDTFVVRSATLKGQTTSYNPAKDTLKVVRAETPAPNNV